MTDDVTPPLRLWRRAAFHALAHAVCAAVVIFVVTRVRWGEKMDARAAASMGSHAHWWMHRIDGITVPLMCLMGFVAAAGVVIQAMRGSRDLACRAVILVAGTQTSAEVLKHLIHREDGALNTTPSGHSSLAVALAFAVIILWPQKLIQGSVLVIAAFIAYGTVVGGWHTPGDVMGACAITGFWSALTLGGAARTVHDGVGVMAFALGMLVAAAGLYAKQVDVPYFIGGAGLVWGSLVVLLNTTPVISKTDASRSRWGQNR